MLDVNVIRVAGVAFWLRAMGIGSFAGRLSDQQCLTSLEQLPQLLEWLPKLSDQISMLQQAQRHGKMGTAAQKDHSEHRD